MKTFAKKYGSMFKNAVVAVAGTTVLMSSMAAGNAFAADHQGGPQVKTGPSLSVTAAQNNVVLQQNGITPDGKVGLKTENTGGNILHERMLEEEVSKQIGKTIKMAPTTPPKVADTRGPGVRVKSLHL